MKILIVEDEIRIREGLEKLLGKLRPEYEIVGRAENGVEGLALCKSEQPDIILTDVKMPQMDGLKMLTAISDAGIRTKAIVLSAYSEFEYARCAMKLGVTEYLLKPIAINDFSQALGNVEQQIAREKLEKPEQVGTLEQVLRDMLDDRMEISPGVLEYLEKNYAIKKDQSFIGICVYLGSRYEQELESVKRQLKHVFSTYEGVSYCILEMPFQKSLILVVYHYEDSHDLERWVQHQLLCQPAGHVSIGWIEISGIEKMAEGMRRLYPYMDWNISLDEDVVISYPKITRVQTVPCIYPVELESQMKIAVCASDAGKLGELIEKFHQRFSDGKIYAPKEVKECYVRFLWAVIGIAKEVNLIDYQQLPQQRLLEEIMNARTRGELMEVAQFVAGKLCFDKAEEETMHLTVKRAKSMIHEFYQTGITLDEIASKLHITPEYLGTQFHREVGVNFSTYLRNYRIGKAKELLCGTTLKLYEIAERVGYADPKYFSKVFREATGMLPAEYRKTYK